MRKRFILSLASYAALIALCLFGQGMQSAAHARASVAAARACDNKYQQRWDRCIRSQYPATCRANAGKSYDRCMCTAGDSSYCKEGQQMQMSPGSGGGGRPTRPSTRPNQAANPDMSPPPAGGKGGLPPANVLETSPALSPQGPGGAGGTGTPSRPRGPVFQ